MSITLTNENASKTLEKVENPRDIVLQPLNVIEISFSYMLEGCNVSYVVIKNKNYKNLTLMNLITGNIIREFPEGTTINRLESVLVSGKIVGFYRTLGDKAKHEGRIKILNGKN